MKRGFRNTKKFLHVKKDDNVKIIAGSDKGKIGKVLQVFHKKGSVIVEGINIKIKNQKPRQEGEKGQIIKQEAPIDSSNVMLYSEKSEIVSRVVSKVNVEGKKVRYLIKNQEVIN